MTSPGGTPARMRFRRDPARVIRIGHRGASAAAPENTLAAFTAALDLGVDAIELDCQLSADGELVVIHDETLERTTNGIGPVCARAWTELAALDAGSWRDGRFRGERIPRLADVLRLVDGRAVVNVEIKSARDLGTIEAKLVQLTMAHDALDWVLFSSFHEPALHNVRARAAQAAIGVLWDRPAPATAIDLATTLAAGCIIPGRWHVDRALVDAAHARGLGVWVWTVNELAEMRRLAAIGVDALFSDHPERFALLADA